MKDILDELAVVRNGSEALKFLEHATPDKVLLLMQAMALKELFF